MLIDVAYKSISDLNLWFKVKSGATLVLNDIPELIKYRWVYFRDEWDTKIKSELLSAVPSYQFPNILTSHIEEFDDFVASQRTSASKVNPFSSLTTQKRFYAIFDATNLYSIPISITESAIIDKTKERVSRFIKSDFLTIRENIAAARDEMADVAGGEDEDYNRIFDRSSAPALVDMNVHSIAEMQILQSAIGAVDFILANIYTIDTMTVDPFALAKQNANNPDFDIRTYSSGTLVKMDYGSDLKMLANKHLGDPDKWIDIAIANGLKAPYIDEVGSRKELIANGSGNQINISGTDDDGNSNADKFFINQQIYIQSDAERKERRSIINIVNIPINGEIVLELDGDADLDRFTLADNSYIRVYKPNTVNSGQYVLIPSTQPLPDEVKADVPWFLSTSGEDEKRAKVDFLIGEDGDLQITPSGDLQLSYGIDNAIQALRLKISVEHDSLLYEKGFGFAPPIGEKTNNITALKQQIADSINTQIASDPRFDQLQSLSVEKAIDSASGANVFLVKIEVRLAGSGTNIPITFSINPN